MRTRSLALTAAGHLLRMDVRRSERMAGRSLRVPGLACRAPRKVTAALCRTAWLGQDGRGACPVPCARNNFGQGGHQVCSDCPPLRPGRWTAGSSTPCHVPRPSVLPRSTRCVRSVSRSRSVTIWTGPVYRLP